MPVFTTTHHSSTYHAAQHACSCRVPSTMPPPHLHPKTRSHPFLRSQNTTPASVSPVSATLANAYTHSADCTASPLGPTPVTVRGICTKSVEKMDCRQSERGQSIPKFGKQKGGRFPRSRWVDKGGTYRDQVGGQVHEGDEGEDPHAAGVHAGLFRQVPQAGALGRRGGREAAEGFGVSVQRVGAAVGKELG